MSMVPKYMETAFLVWSLDSRIITGGASPEKGIGVRVSHLIGVGQDIPSVRVPPSTGLAKVPCQWMAGFRVGSRWEALRKRRRQDWSWSYPAFVDG